MHLLTLRGLGVMYRFRFQGEGAYDAYMSLFIGLGLMGYLLVDAAAYLMWFAGFIPVCLLLSPGSAVVFFACFLGSRFQIRR